MLQKEKGLEVSTVRSAGNFSAQKWWDQVECH